MTASASVRIRAWYWLLPGSLAVLGAVVLFWFDPSRHAFYPTCLFHKTTGWLCPGCGSLRAMHQLLHGHFVTAFRFNPMLISWLPFLAWYGVRCFRQNARNESLAGLAPRPGWLWAFLGVTLIFGLLRNLPGIPFLALPQ